MATDVDDTTGCPTGDRCATCGGVDDLAVATAGTAVGVYCLTLCVDCDDQALPVLSGWAEAAERVCEHCEHLGVTVDEAAVLRRAKADDWWQ